MVLVAYLLALSVGLVIWVVRKWWNSGGPTPFTSTVSPAKPFVADQKKRDAVLKQSFTAASVPENLDAIVVGSGIGGLACAALLSKSGLKVLVLEQHDQAGGCCHTFVDKGYEFDVGIHYVGQCDYGNEIRILSDQITDGQLVWVPLDNNFDTVVLGDPAKNPKWFPMVSGRQKYRENLIKMFPNHAMAIDKFVKLLNKCNYEVMGMALMKILPLFLSNFLVATGLVHLMTRFFRSSEKSLKQVAEELTDDKELQAVFSYCFGDYGVLPENAPWPMEAMLITHFWKGAFYPRGGASEIAFHTIPVIEKSAGKVLVRANVTEIILTPEGRACGVRVEKGTTVTNVFAKVIISDAGVINTFRKLLPPDVGQKSRYNTYMRKVGPGIGAMSVFVGLNGDSNELQLKSGNVWSFIDTDINEICKNFYSKTLEEALEAEIPLAFVSFPSAKDPEWSNRYPGKSACTIVTLARYDWFKEWETGKVNHRGDEYERTKKVFGFKLWEHVTKLFPQLADKMDHIEVGTPVTNQYYIGSTSGEIYGLDHGMSRFTPEICAGLRPETDVPGLYLTGQDVMTCGFAGALEGAVLCASKVLNRNLHVDLMAEKKRLREEMKTKRV